MVKANKHYKGSPRINLRVASTNPLPSEPSLLLQRIKELDHEFARQSKQLRKLTKRLTRKIIEK